MEPLSRDTSPEAEAVMWRILRGMTMEQRVRQVGELNRMARAAALAGLRGRYPKAGPEELKLRLAALVLGRETVMRVYGWDPEVEGY